MVDYLLERVPAAAGPGAAVAVVREQPQADLVMAADHQHLHGRQRSEAVRK